MELNWESKAQDLFNKLIEKTPIFVREMAKEKVTKKAIESAKACNHSEVIEKDVVDAFFSETPGGFHGPLRCDMDDLGVDYKKYGHDEPKITWGFKKKQ